MCSSTEPAVPHVVTLFGEVGSAVGLRTLLRLWKRGGDRTEVLRSSVVAAWCAGPWSTCTFLCFCFLLLNKAGAATVVSRVLTAPVRSRRFCSSFSPAVGQEVAFSSTTRAAFVVVLEARQRREPPAHHRCPCHLLRRVFFGSLSCGLKGGPSHCFFFFYFSFCCWRLFLVSCKRFPASSVLLFVRGWWKEREKGQLYLGKWLLNCLCGAQ